MLDIADVADWQSAKIAVLDDFGFQLINYLMSSKKVPLRNIYFLVSEEDEVKVELMRKWYSNFLENTILQTYNIDMSFDLIIANPPYGKSSSLSKKIVNTLLENKVAKEMVVLAPWRTFEENLEHVKDWKNIPNVFEDAAVAGLTIVELFSDKVKKYKEVAEVLLNENQYKLYSALQTYNKENKCKAICRAFDKQIDDVLSGKLKPNNWFLVTKRSANNKVHTGDKSKDFRYNLLGEDIKDAGIVFCDSYFAFSNKEALRNFTDWWYKVPGKGVDAQKTLVYQLLTLIQDLTGSSNDSKWYNIIFPNLDWSHPWTDKEILKEIGLPEDFLEEK
jgi:hypothetical protein